MFLTSCKNNFSSTWVDWFLPHVVTIRKPTSMDRYPFQQWTRPYHKINLLTHTHTTFGKNFKIASQPLLNIKTYFFPFWQTPISHVLRLYGDLRSGADGKLPKNGSMTFDKFTCTKTDLGRHFQLTSQTHVFNTWSIFFCSHYATYYFSCFWQIDILDMRPS